MASKVLIYNGSKIQYKVFGTGTPVMLVHGFAEDSSIWDLQVATLQHNFFLLIPDLPGSGQSGILKKEDAGIDDYADCLLQILLIENITQCIMIGHSMGGYITLAFAEKHPTFLKAIGLFHSSAYADSDEKITTRKKAIAFMQANGTEKFLQTSIPGLFYNNKNNKVAIASLIKKGKRFTLEALVQYYQAMIQRPDRTTVLKKFKGKIMFIIGLNDTTVPFLQSLQQTHQPLYSYIYILRNSAHIGMMEEPEKANKSLIYFLQNA